MIKVRWEKQLHQAGSDSCLAVTADAVVVHARHNRLLCLDPEDGSVRWDVHVGTWPRALAITGRQCLVLPQTPDQLLCLNLDTGERIWSADLPPYTGHVVVDDGTVLVGGWRGYTTLRVLDMATGQVRQETTDRVHTVRPVATDEGLLTGEPEGNLVRLIDRRDFRELHVWRLPQPLAHYETRAAFTSDGQGRFLIRCGDRAVMEIVPSAGTMREVVLAENDLAFSAPEIVGDRLWLREPQANYTLADPHNGRLLRRVTIPHHPADRIVPIDTEAVQGFLIANMCGCLFQLDTNRQIIERTTVTQKIHALQGIGHSRAVMLTKGTLLAVSVEKSADQKTRSRSR